MYRGGEPGAPERGPCVPTRGAAGGRSRSSLSIGGQRITSIITADAVREMRLKNGQTVAALVKSTEVMIIRLRIFVFRSHFVV